jgi:CheY-like chemotaxis protein
MGEFVANMSHEIRTPLTAVLGYADILVEENWGRKSQEYAEIIKRNGEHLLAIINDILDLSKIEAGRLEMARATCSPHEIVSEAMSLLRVRAASKGLSLETVYYGRVPETIRTDATRVRQILLNLMGNAIKFTERGGVRVTVRLAGEGSDATLQIEVADSGIGMTPAQMRRLFRPFQQVDAAITQEYGGTGLGLAMSKRLAGLLGGDISVESEAGRGSAFRLTLPAGPADQLRLVTYSGEVREPSICPEMASSERPAMTPVCARVLLVEDGPDSCRLIKLMLEKAMANVTVAQNGREAVELALSTLRDDDVSAQKEVFDVIFMDMQMPVMDGYAATRELRSRGYTGPIVALTASAMSTDRAKCLEAGCDDFATKPLDRVELVEIMRRHSGQPALAEVPS